MMMRIAWPIAAAATALLALSACGHAQTIRGPVVRVIDGDTLVLLVNRRQVHVRLAQIDAPEHDQPWGKRSKQQLAAFVARRDAVIEDDGHDRYGRTIGEVFVDGKDVNRAMVAAGMAWAYRRYLHDPSLLAVERDAVRGRRGLWADPHPIPPWQWRHER